MEEFKLIMNMTQKIDTIILDLDGTLIKTEKLKDVFKQIAIDHGCTSDEADDVYKNSRTEKDERGTERLVFSRDHFAEVLKEFLVKKGVEVGEIDFSKLNNELNESILLPGATELIEGAKKQGKKIYLITLGEGNWQKEKLKASGLEDYFSFGEGEEDANIIITDDNEAEEGRKLGAIRDKFGKDFTGEGAAFVNDKPWETKKLSLGFENMECFVIPDLDDDRYNEADFKRAQDETIDGGGKFERVKSLTEFKKKFLTSERFDGIRK